ncbi:hypothetical protein SynROS8604_00422 [Synechococcus sp. ROS8604]|nr:hypothetical protein SynROS8604_00422 [Synechococcus sp. ROS8604]
MAIFDDDLKAYCLINPVFKINVYCLHHLGLQEITCRLCDRQVL